MEAADKTKIKGILHLEKKDNRRRIRVEKGKKKKRK